MAFFDDIFVFKTNITENDKNLINIPERTKKSGLTLNNGKLIV